MTVAKSGEAILFLFGCSEVNQRARKALFTCVVYTKLKYCGTEKYKLTTNLPFDFFQSKIPYKGSYNLKDCDDRRKWVERMTSTSLSNVGQWLDPRNTKITTENFSGNIENLIGLAKIPLGVVGPLRIKGGHVDEDILCPFATTEGAIVASASRGANAITRWTHL